MKEILIALGAGALGYIIATRRAINIARSSARATAVQEKHDATESASHGALRVVKDLTDAAGRLAPPGHMKEVGAVAGRTHDNGINPIEPAQFA